MNKTRIALEALITEKEGMIAENDYDRIIGRTPAYERKSFNQLADRMRKLGEEMPASSKRTARIAMELLFIPVGERLPVEGDRVFVIQRSNTIGPGPQRAYRTSMEQGDSVPDFYWWLDRRSIGKKKDCPIRLYDVTHWAEIPQVEEDCG